MAVGDIYQVCNEFEYQKNPNEYNFFLHVRAEAGPTKVEADMLSFGVARETAWLPLHVASVNFRCVTARQVYPNNSLPGQQITGNVGTRSCMAVGAYLPGQCSAVVTLYGDSVNPTASNRGRDFITGQCSEDQIEGVWGGAAGYLNALCQYYVAMGNSFVVGGNEYDIGIYSPSRAKPPGDPPPPPIVPFFWPLEKSAGPFVGTNTTTKTATR